MYLFVSIIESSIMKCIFNFDWINVYSCTKTTLPCKLNQIASTAATSIHDIGTVLSKNIAYSLSSMFCNGLRCHWVPALFIKLYSSIEFAEQVVSLFVKLLDVFCLWLLYFDVGVIIPLWAFVSVVIVSMIYEGFEGPFEYHHYLFLCLLVCMYSHINVI